MSLFFERLIDCMVYELYFEESIKAAGCEVLKHLQNLPEFKGDEQIIINVFNELNNAKHPVTIAMMKMDTVEEVRIIEGKNK